MSKQAAHVFVVQFPHPGPERNPGYASRQPWNTGDHRRKFMCCPGRYVDVDRDGSLAEAKLTFWGEWEPPSDIVERWPERGSLPRFLHVPVWEHSAPKGRQNTDPWVFGDHFRHSNCGQQARPALHRLTPGSIILFGSGLAKTEEFIVDTAALR